MARNSLQRSEDRNTWTYDQLLIWHLQQNTRAVPAAPQIKLWVQKEFAGELHVTPRYLRSWLSGARVPNEAQHERIERLLFGSSPAHQSYLAELRAAYSRVNSSYVVPESQNRSRARQVGRDAELADLVIALTRRLPAAAVVLGPPGMGKTLLAEEVMQHSSIVEQFGDRRWMVRLDTATDADALVAEILREIGLDSAKRSIVDLIQYLRQSPSLLVLDNLETPWEPTDVRGEVERRLDQLARIPQLALLASLRGAVAPFKPLWARECLLEPLTEAHAQQLFLSRAPRISPVDPDLPALLQELDGMPLAIALVAYRTGHDDTLRDVWSDFQERGIEIAAHPADATSVWRAIELSLRSPRLGPEAERLFRLLGDLPGGVAGDDYETVLGKGARAASRQLVDLGLAFRRNDRLSLLAPVRDFARRYRQSDGPADWRQHYLTLVSDLGPKLLNKDGNEARARLAPEVANLLVACRDGAAQGLLHQVLSAVPYVARSLIATGLGSLSSIQAVADACHDDVEARAICLENIGEVALARSQHTVARQSFEQALACYRSANNALGVANCTKSLGDVALGCGEEELAQTYFERALKAYRRVPDSRGEANCLRSLGDHQLQLENYPAARRALNRARALYDELSDDLGRAVCMQRIGEVAIKTDDLDTAGTELGCALKLYREIGDDLGAANCASGAAEIALRRKPPDHRTARAALEQALSLYRVADEPVSIGVTHCRLAELTSGGVRLTHIGKAREMLNTTADPRLAELVDRCGHRG